MYHDHVPQQRRTNVKPFVTCEVTEEMQLEWRRALCAVVFSDFATNALALFEGHQDLLAHFSSIWQVRAARVAFLLHQLVAPAMRVIYTMRESDATLDIERSSLGLTHP